MRRRGAAQQLKLALTLTLALAAGGVKKPDMTHRGFEKRTFGSPESSSKSAKKQKNDKKKSP